MLHNHFLLLIKEKINQNSIIFLTGNPGDGKTHLIKKLENEISTNVEIIYEAGVIQKEELKKRIDEGKKSVRIKSYHYSPYFTQ